MSSQKFLPTEEEEKWKCLGLNTKVKASKFVNVKNKMLRTDM
jgi:hypothetical protein